ncbi:MAG: hypothetical protein ACWA6U_16605 [Breznakibacter sp.]
MKTVIILVISLFVPLICNAIEFEQKLKKEFTKSIYLWVYVHNAKERENSILLIQQENKRLTEYYTKGGKNVYILYMNNLKGIPPAVESENHAKSIVLRSLSTTVMKLYFVAYCETRKPTNEILYNPVESLESLKYKKLEE